MSHSEATWIVHLGVWLHLPHVSLVRTTGTNMQESAHVSFLKKIRRYELKAREEVLSCRTMIFHPRLQMITLTPPLEFRHFHSSATPHEIACSPPPSLAHEGKPILQLKPKHVEIVKLKFTDEERESLAGGFADPTLLLGSDAEKERGRAPKLMGKPCVDLILRKFLDDEDEAEAGSELSNCLVSLPSAHRLQLSMGDGIFGEGSEKQNLVAEKVYEEPLAKGLHLKGPKVSKPKVSLEDRFIDSDDDMPDAPLLEFGRGPAVLTVLPGRVTGKRGKPRSPPKRKVENEDDDVIDMPSDVPSNKMLDMMDMLKEWEITGDKTSCFSQCRQCWASLRIGAPLAIAYFVFRLNINLTSANRTINWNDAAETQACDRARRNGQDKEVFVKRLVVENTIEER
ncbi:hypothetical protein R3P38DRAFT_2800603 [Favolaschia claudopus]|uniref:Uncharacterized protein n=1 Tax=Favolaschia claudopus TaxID=2862362 RepID=A0AAV9ZX37_9AGAR